MRLKEGPEEATPYYMALIITTYNALLPPWEYNQGIQGGPRGGNTVVYGLDYKHL
jgi:hypothetical protein